VYDRRVAALTAINDKGAMLGTLDNAPPFAGAPVLLINGVTAPLDSLVTDPGGRQRWTFVTATRINNAGQILARALDPFTRVPTTVLITPPTPP
jgi:hypothetical protein